jgi:hypothetical protein
MIEVTSITVKSFDLDHLDIFWTLSDDQIEERVEEYDFVILRSIDGVAGPYYPLGKAFYNTYHFRDPDVQMLHKWRLYFYKIKMTHRESGRESEYGPSYLQAEPDRLALEFQRREGMLFQRKAGRVVLLFPRLTFGQRCVHCWDTGPRGNTIFRSKQQNCASCFDTTFVGGYASPITVHMQIDPSPMAPQRTDFTEHQFIVSSARTVAFPPIRPKDLLIEGENIRWSVEKVSSTQKMRAVIRQELEIRQYPKDDIRYALPVNFDVLTNFTPSEAKKRPMDIQDDEDRPLQDLLSTEK